MNPKGLITDAGIKKKKGNDSSTYLYTFVVESLRCVPLFCDPMDCTRSGSSVYVMSMCSSLLPDKNPVIGCNFLLRIFPNQRSNLRLCHCKRILYNWATRGAHFYTYSTIKNKIHCIWICKGWNFSLLFLRIHNCSWHVGSFLTFAGWNCSVHSYVYRGVCPAVFCAKKVHWLALSGDLSSPHLIIHNRLAVVKVVYVGVKEREKKKEYRESRRRQQNAYSDRNPTHNHCFY